MINKSKELLNKKNIDYKRIAFLLNVTERQAMNILSYENKALINYLKIAYVSGLLIEEMFHLDEKERDELFERNDLYNRIKK